MKTSVLVKIADNLLEELSDMQGNAGCNDYNLARLVPDAENRRELIKEFNRLNGSPEDFFEDMKSDKNFSYCMDFMMTYVIKEWLKSLPEGEVTFPLHEQADS